MHTQRLQSKGKSKWGLKQHHSPEDLPQLLHEPTHSMIFYTTCGKYHMSKCKQHRLLVVHRSATAPSVCCMRGFTAPRVTHVAGSMLSQSPMRSFAPRHKISVVAHLRFRHCGLILDALETKRERLISQAWSPEYAGPYVRRRARNAGYSCISNVIVLDANPVSAIRSQLTRLEVPKLSAPARAPPNVRQLQVRMRVQTRHNRCTRVVRDKPSTLHMWEHNSMTGTIRSQLILSAGGKLAVNARPRLAMFRRSCSNKGRLHTNHDERSFTQVLEPTHLQLFLLSRPLLPKTLCFSHLA
jgi:hypothetical protein